MNSLKERLDILQTTNTITARARDIANQAIEKYVNDENADSYTMLVTHLAMAVSRIDRQEPLSGPPDFVMKEVYESSHLDEAERRVTWIEDFLGHKLPTEEKQFLLMHFVSVLNK
ncbi:PRD domain-containing protein [Bacillus sp. FJAT-27251]|uniref:PRD domain-containing protein n=1 Tax=Bacillus sp. FJAT-27251 TaxID=1684142 RepID=UPI0006A78B49|nr:PRD domain-containing protein [Bacillus sp. FJAT-27251]